ncbi:MAG: hypothetical protein ACI4T5_09665 [Prevotella sp.]
MNENKLYSKRQHTRIQFSPLHTSCALKCITPQSPLTQSVNTYLSPVEYEPDRSLSFTAVMPFIKTIDPDGIFLNGQANEYLSLDTMAWYIDNTKLPNSSWTKGTHYDIVTDSNDTRGMIKIYKNIPAGEKHSLKFRGEFLDWRTNIVYKVESDEIEMSSTDKGEDIYSCTADRTAIEYDPFYDTLLKEEYMKGKGLISAISSAAQSDPKNYKQSVNINLTYGLKRLTSLPSGMTSRLVKLGSTTAITANSTANPEVIYATFPKYTFDCRLIEQASYEWQMLKGSTIMARVAFSITRKLTMPSTFKPMFNADINPSMTFYNNRAFVSLKDRPVEYPELLYLINWYTIARIYNGTAWADGASVKWQRGERISADISKIGIGHQASDCYFDLSFELEPMPVCELLLDDDGTALLDDDGTMLID